MKNKFNKKRVGIILAGGSGSRMYPLTQGTSKQLLPIFDKPMIYYPFNTLLQAGIKDICIITNPEHINSMRKVFKDIDKMGINLKFKVQIKPNGIAEALIIAKDFIKKSSICLILGDNIIFGEKSELLKKLKIANENKEATIFSKEVKNPEQYGVAKIENKRVIEIIEKPKKLISNRAVIGLYFFPNSAISIAKKLKPSSRNELEITDVNNFFIQKDKAKIINFSKKINWFDAGTHQDYFKVNKKIHDIQKKNKIKIGSIHLTSIEKKFSNKKNVIFILRKFQNSQYSSEVLKSIK